MPFDHWLTPPDVLGRVRRVMPTIDLDPASNDVAAPYVGATRYCVAPGIVGPLLPHCEVDGLAVEWAGNVWCNPPYSAGLIDAFTTKLLDEWRTGHIEQAIYLVNSSTDSQWYHDALAACSALLLWRGHVKFWKIQDGQAWPKWISSTTGKLTNAPRYQNSLFYFGSNVNAFAAAFAGCGTIVRCHQAPAARQVSLFEREAA